MDSFITYIVTTLDTQDKDRTKGLVTKLEAINASIAEKDKRP